MIIGIHGRAGHGKDSTADHLVKKYGFTKYSFASPIKEASKAIFGFTDEQFTDPKLKNEIDSFWGISPVQTLLSLGTEWGQYDIHRHLKQYGSKAVNWGRGIWVQSFKRWHEKKIKEDPNFKCVISDIRFKHEVYAVKEMGGRIIKVVRPGYDDKANIGRMNHSSETELNNYKDWDGIINPGIGGGLDILYTCTDNVIRGFL